MAYENNTAPVVTPVNNNAQQWEKALSFLNFEFVDAAGQTHKLGAIRLLASDDLGKALHERLASSPEAAAELINRIRINWRSGERQHKQVNLGF